MTRTTKYARRMLVAAAALAAVALLAPIAGASDCTVAKNASCRNQDMRHLGKQMMYADMTGADMRGADMRGMNLTGVNLTGADMRGAKLNGATMNGAVLKGTMMNGITMKNVKMTGVTLDKTKLQGAKLTNVKIDQAIITGIDIRGASFTGGGMTNSTITAMKSGHTPRRASTRAWCGGGAAGSGTSFNGSGFGLAWERLYSFAGSTLSGDYSCDLFNGINWDGATIKDANFQSTVFANPQDHSEQIVALGVDFSGAQFNSAFWRPGIALHVNLYLANCPPVNGDQSNAVWGRYNFTSPYWVGSTQSGHWAYGIVTSTAFGDIQFQGSPAVVSLNRARQTSLAPYYGNRPYLTGTTDCARQAGADGAY